MVFAIEEQGHRAMSTVRIAGDGGNVHKVVKEALGVDIEGACVSSSRDVDDSNAD